MFALAGASRPGDAGDVLLAVGLGACAVLLAVGLGACAVLALGLLLPRPTLLALALLGLASEYIAGLAVSVGAVDGWAPLAAVALFAIAELAYWSAGARWRARGAPGVLAGRAAPLVLVGVAGLALAALAALLAALPIPGGAGLTIAGIAAVAALLALIAALAQRSGAG